MGVERKSNWGLSGYSSLLLSMNILEIDKTPLVIKDFKLTLRKV
jgi:hypothetical protein